jgi:hypothetical protein
MHSQSQVILCLGELVSHVDERTGTSLECVAYW